MFNSPWRTISVGEVYETERTILILSLFGLFDDQLRLSRLIESGSSRLPNLFPCGGREYGRSSFKVSASERLGEDVERWRLNQADR